METDTIFNQWILSITPIQMSRKIKVVRGNPNFSITKA